MKTQVLAFLILTTALTSACSSVRYYGQATFGHLSLLHKARPISDVLEEVDPTTADALKLIGRARAFATEQLSLDFNDSYTTYVDLGRDYVVKNLFVAEEFSTELYSWCYLVIGCAKYRGFFNEDLLVEEERQFIDEGYDVYVAPVTAYSTLGWFRDPVINTFVYREDYQLAGLIFHELAHQHIYVNGATVFNESFAVTVEQEGIARFFAGEAKPRLAAYQRRQNVRSAINTLAQTTRDELTELYRQPMTAAGMRKRKAEILEKASVEYESITGYPGVTLNNANLGSIAAYSALVPAFQNMLRVSGGDLPAFYAQVRFVADLSESARDACMEEWLEADDGRGASPRCSLDP
ncbi:MAG: aminopeptidase [Pseudomonadota bacterium]